MTRILAIGAHPDDVEFGCGGYLAALARTQARTVHLLVLCGGQGPPTRRREAEQASEVLGVSGLAFGQERDTEVDEARTRETIERALASLRPAEVLVHAPADSHQDHRTAARAAIAATRRCRRVLFYETPSTLVFGPTLFADIGATLSVKLAALRAHASQVDKTWAGTLTLDQMADALAVSRGIQGRMNRAEGFEPLRWELG